MEFIHIKKNNKASTVAEKSLASKNDGAKPIVDNRPESIMQKKQVKDMAEHGSKELIQKKENNTGLPDNLKSGIENLSGLDMSDTKVHYNSDKPAQLNAHAFAQGTDIHLANGQEKHLPHEAWHVVQQKQGRVKPTMQMKGKVNVNDDVGLEKEANVMGAKAIQFSKPAHGTGCGCGDCSARTALPPTNSNNLLQVAQLQCEICGEEEGHEEQCPYSESSEEEPQAARRGHFNAINLLPRENEMSSFNHLADIGTQAHLEVGYYAPQTTSYSIGMQPITPSARDRERNEQGIGLLNLAQQEPFNMDVSSARARHIAEASGIELPSQMTGPLRIQSLHGVASSLGNLSSGRNPMNYAVGSRGSNLSMQGYEDPLGSSALRRHFNLETIFYSDPRAPIAHGLSSRIQHNNSSVPSLIINQSGLNTSNTYEGVSREQAIVQEYLQYVANNPPARPPTPSEVYSHFPYLTREECFAISSMIMSSQTLILGDNPWQGTAIPLEGEESSSSMDFSQEFEQQEQQQEAQYPGVIHPPLNHDLNAGNMVLYYGNAIIWANNQGTYSREFHLVRDHQVYAANLLNNAGMDAADAQYFVQNFEVLIDQYGEEEGYVDGRLQEHILNQLGVGEQLLAIIRYLLRGG